MGASVFALNSATMLAVIAAIVDFSSISQYSKQLVKKGLSPPEGRVKASDQA